MKYLISTTETYRVDNENEMEEIIEKAKEQSTVKPPKVSHEYKERKAKGEVIDAWYKVVITNYFTDEKEPESITTVNYSVGSNFS